MSAVAIDLDACLGNTRPLWEAFLADAARRFHAIAELDVEALPEDRAAAAALLDRWSEQGIGDWRAAMTRFAEDRAPVYLRPSADAAAALRRLSRAGTPIGVFTDAPEELARLALTQLGAARHVTALEAGADARARLLERLGPGATVAETREELSRAAAGP